MPVYVPRTFNLRWASSAGTAQVNVVNYVEAGPFVCGCLLWGFGFARYYFNPLLRPPLIQITRERLSIRYAMVTPEKGARPLAVECVPLGGASSIQREVTVCSGVPQSGPYRSLRTFMPGVSPLSWRRCVEWRRCDIATVPPPLVWQPSAYPFERVAEGRRCRI
jgi:hypothetical protein